MAARKRKTGVRGASAKPPRSTREKKDEASPTHQPELFIASASEDLQVVRDVARWVRSAGARPRPWKGEFPIGWFTLQALVEVGHRVDGAIIVASGLDRAKVRGKPRTLPRDNVLLELGMFISALSQQRTALVVVHRPDDPGPKLPDDLAGLTYVPYRCKGDQDARQSLIAWIQKEFFPEVGANTVLAIRNGKRYTWDDVVRGINYIQLRMQQDEFIPDVVLALGRSGAVLGGLLAAFMGSIPLSFADLEYIGGIEPGNRYQVKVHAERKWLSGLDNARRVLVIEGATTTGETPMKAMDLLARLFPDIDFRFAVLIQCAGSRFGCHYYAYLERSTLVSHSGRSLLPWHGPASRTFLALAAQNST